MKVDDKIDGGFCPDPARADFTLPEGTYKLEVVGGECRATPTTITLVLRVRVLSGLASRPDSAVPVGVELLHYLPAWDLHTASEVGRELRVLGEDVDEWTVAKGRPFSSEVRLSATRVVGAVVLAVKRLRVKQSGQVYHNLKFLRAVGPDEPIPGSDRAYLTRPGGAVDA